MSDSFRSSIIHVVFSMPCQMTPVALESALPRGFVQRRRPSEAVAAETRLSRSQRRKLRDRRVAIRKALVSSAAVKAQLQIAGTSSLMIDTEVKSVCLSSLSQQVDEMASKIDYILQFLYNSLPTWNGYTDVESRPQDTVVFNPDAEMFVLAYVPSIPCDEVTVASGSPLYRDLHNEAAIVIQRFYRSCVGDGHIRGTSCASSDYDYNCEA